MAGVFEFSQSWLHISFSFGEPFFNIQPRLKCVSCFWCTFSECPSLNSYSRRERTRSTSGLLCYCLMLYAYEQICHFVASRPGLFDSKYFVFLFEWYYCFLYWFTCDWSFWNHIQMLCLAAICYFIDMLFNPSKRSAKWLYRLRNQFYFSFFLHIY